MSRVFIYLILFLAVSCLHASAAEPELLNIKIDTSDQSKLQRGATLFMNYCSGCHSLRYMRYNRMAEDLGLTTFDGSIDSDLLKNNLIFTQAKIHDPIQISMPEVDARQWFGKLPPDLSLSARERGAPWLYTYLRSFYIDKSRPFGTNNLLIPDVAMPNILAPLEGEVVAMPSGGGLEHLSNSNLVLVGTGEMNEQQFDSAVQDLVTFLVYVAEPGKQAHHRLGLIVLIFLGLLIILAYRLKKAYWRNIH